MERKYLNDFGGEGEVIVLLHGYLSSSKYWRMLQPKLSRIGYRVITLDLLGFGKAPKPMDSGYSYDEHIEHIDNALKEMSINKPFLIMGHSMGALLAVRYSYCYTNKVKSLILLHPPLYENKEQTRRTLRSTSRIYRFLLDSRYRNYIWIALRNFGPVVRHTRYSRENSMVNIIEQADILNELKDIHKDTLLFVGARDRKEYLINLLHYRFHPKVRVVIEKVGHHSPQLRPNLIVKHFNDFISKIT